MDNKFSVDEDEGSENLWAKVAGKHIEAKLGLVSSDVESVQKLYKIHLVRLHMVPRRG